MNPEDSIPPDERKDIVDLATQLSTPLTEGPGTTIGPCKLLDKLGEGGFGVVWDALRRTSVQL